jgi:SCP1.201-like deaminase
LTPLQASAWAQTMVGGGRTVEPAGGSSQRPDTSARKIPSVERRRDDDQAEPEATKAGATADVGGKASPTDQPAPPRISDEQGRDLQQRLPARGKDPGYRPKTRGLWVDEDGQEHDLISGETDFHDDVRQFLIDNRIGRSHGQLMVASHVEAKFAMFMRQTGRMHERSLSTSSPAKVDGDANSSSRTSSHQVPL